MPKFTVTMQRMQTAQVTIEAANEKEARKMLKDQEVRWEYFAAHGDGYSHGDIKITGVKPKELSQ